VEDNESQKIVQAI